MNTRLLLDRRCSGAVLLAASLAGVACDPMPGNDVDIPARSNEAGDDRGKPDTNESPATEPQRAPETRTPPGDAGATIDAGPPAGESPDGAPPPGPAPCVNRDPAPWDGHHRQGASCTEGCHDGRTFAGPPFTLGGTLYDKITAGAAVAGATILITDAQGKEVRLVTGQNGNFYTREPLAFPIRASVSACPTTVPMVSTIGASAQGARTSCNAGACHDPARRIYLLPK